MFISGPLLSISWAKWIYSTPFHPVSLQSVITLFCHLCQGFQNVLLILPHLNSVLISRLCQMCHIPCKSPPSWFHHPNNIWCMKFLIMHFSPVSCFFYSLRSFTFLITLLLNALNAFIICLYLNPWHRAPFKSHISATGQSTFQFKCLLLHCFILWVVFRTFLKLESLNKRCVIKNVSIFLWWVNQHFEDHL